MNSSSDDETKLDRSKLNKKTKKDGENLYMNEQKTNKIIKLKMHNPTLEMQYEFLADAAHLLASEQCGDICDKLHAHTD